MEVGDYVRLKYVTWCDGAWALDTVGVIESINTPGSYTVAVKWLTLLPTDALKYVLYSTDQLRVLEQDEITLFLLTKDCLAAEG